MTDYVDPTLLDFDPKDPLTSERLIALRDNPTAITEGAVDAPRIQTAALEDSAVTTAKILDDNVTTDKLNVGTKTYTGSLAASASVSFALDTFSFTPIVTGSNIVGDFRNGSIYIVNGDPSVTQNYTVTWKYLIT